MNKVIFLFFLVSVFTILTTPLAHGADKAVSIEFQTLKSPDVIVRFEDPLLEAAKEVARLYPSIKDQLVQELQQKARIRPAVFLIRRHEIFAMVTGNEMVVAFAEPERQAIVIDYSRMAARPINLAPTLKHELCHLLLHAHIPTGLPRWFDEGVCQWVTGGVADIIADERKPLLWEAAAGGRLLPLRELSTLFPEERYGTTLAYEESKSVVDYIVSSYGTTSLLRIIAGLSDGKSMDDAIKETLGVTTAELERDWTIHLGRRFTWLIYVTSNVYEILFFFASLVTVLGALKIIIGRMRRGRSHEEEEEDRRE